MVGKRRIRTQRGAERMLASALLILLSCGCCCVWTNFATSHVMALVSLPNQLSPPRIRWQLTYYTRPRGVDSFTPLPLASSDNNNDDDSNARTEGTNDDDNNNNNNNNNKKAQSLLHFISSDAAGKIPQTPPSSSSSQTSPIQDETQRRIEEQQRQIDTLMELVVQHQQPTPSQTTETSSSSSSSTTSTPNPSSSSTTSTTVAPIKAMMFIDGTWLYYSIHERQEDRCPIAKKYGMGWQTRYAFDWAALPRILCEQLQLQQVGWSSTSSTSNATGSAAAATSTRPVEVVRASVFTSVKKDTSRYSNRLRMFEDMNNNNYDVHMMETVGPGEKCVDIQLAVEMLHYATVPSAYDVAILVSGDKDFLPALIRTRQKARQVCIVSMRSSCNRALYETPNVKDYEPIWIEDFLDQLMVPRASDFGNKPTVSVFALMKVIYDFIDKASSWSGGNDRAVVSSRDIGRYLKRLEIGDRILLDEVKEAYGGLFQFLTVSGCFEVLKRPPTEALRRASDPTNKAFWATLRETAEETLLAEAKRTQFSVDEKKFFDTYSTESLDDGTAYTHGLRHAQKQYSGGHNDDDDDDKLELPETLTRDFSKLKVVELKEICKQFELPVSGTKAALQERVETDVKKQVEQLKKDHKARIGMKRVRVSSGSGGGKHSPLPENSMYLEKLIREYLQASGGEASSRDVGRYLAANTGYNGKRGSKALTELKRLYGGLGAFLAEREDVFRTDFADSTDGSNYEFRIALRKSD